MDMQSRSFDTAKLLAETAWLRRLARGLVVSEHDADDLAHDAVLAALEHRPATDRSLRGWLATVVRRMRGSAERSRSRRAAREAAIAPKESLDSPEELIERVELHERLLAEVKQLDPHFREVIVLRFFGGMGLEEIARRIGVPAATARTRLFRGLARLRARLDAAGGGDDRRWRHGLLPLLSSPLIPSPVSIFGVLCGGIMQKSFLTAVAVVCLGLGAYWLSESSDDVVRSTEAEVVAPPPRIEPPIAPVLAPDVERENVVVDVPAPETPPASVEASVAPDAEPLSSPHEATIRGRVVDAVGAGVADAQVALRGTTRRTGANGEFEIPLRDVGAKFLRQTEAEPDSAIASGRIRAMKPGMSPGVFDAPVEADPVTGRLAPVFPPFVVLQLGPNPLGIAGRVVDAAGMPVPSALVWIANPTFFAFDSSGEAMLLENHLCADATNATPPGPPWRKITADAQGRFEIDGLAAREYRVEAMDGAHVFHVAVDGVVAGKKDCLLALPTDLAFSRVAGRVVGRNGRPIAGALIRATRDAYRRPGGVWMESGSIANTDGDGRFELRTVARSGVYLRVTGAGFEPTELAHGAAGLADATPNGVEDIVIVVTREIPLAVELIHPDRADSFAALDAEGNELRISVDDGAGSRWSTDRMTLESGVRKGMVLPESAATLVLYREDEIVDRLPVQIAEEGITIVRG